MAKLSGIEVTGAIQLLRANGSTPTVGATLDAAAFTAGAIALTLTGADGLAPTNSGSSLALIGGDGNTSGPGGPVDLIAGDGGSTGDGASIGLTPGDHTAGAVGAINLNAPGDGVGETAELRFLELVAGGTNFTGFKSPDALAGDIMYTLPSVAPTAAQVLSSTAGGVLSWVAGGGGGVADFQGAYDGGSDWTLDATENGMVVTALLNTTPALTIRGAANSGQASDNERVLVLELAQSEAFVPGLVLQRSGATDLAMFGLGNNGVDADLTLQMFDDVRGFLRIQTGDQTGATTSGNLEFKSGSSQAGGTGNVLLEIGDSNGGTDGSVQIAQAAGQGRLRLLDASGNFIGLQAPSTTQDTDYELPAARGTAGQVLAINAAAALTTLEWITAAGTGDVVGPASATNNALPRYDTTTGKLIQNSLVTVADTGGMTISATANPSLAIPPVAVGAGNTGEIRLLELAAGGTNFSGFKAPDALATNLMYTLPSVAPTAAQVLSSTTGGVLSWEDNVGGVTSVFTRSGAVVAVASDYDASQVDNDSGVTGAFVDDALNTLNAGKASTAHAATHSDGGSDEITVENLAAGTSDTALRLAPDGAGGLTFAASPAAPVTSVFSRTGLVVAVASDYDASQVDNDSSVVGAFVDDALNTLDLGKVENLQEAYTGGNQLTTEAAGDSTDGSIQITATLNTAPAFQIDTVLNVAGGEVAIELHGAAAGADVTAPLIDFYEGGTFSGTGVRVGGIGPGDIGGGTGPGVVMEGAAEDGTIYAAVVRGGTSAIVSTTAGTAVLVGGTNTNAGGVGGTALVAGGAADGASAESGSIQILTQAAFTVGSILIQTAQPDTTGGIDASGISIIGGLGGDVVAGTAGAGATLFVTAGGAGNGGDDNAAGGSIQATAGDGGTSGGIAGTIFLNPGVGNVVANDGSVAILNGGGRAKALQMQADNNAVTGFVAGATGPGGSVIYVLPVSAPTAGQVLSAAVPSAGRSVLSWIAAGDDLATVLAVANITGGTDIVLSSGDQIITPAGSGAGAGGLLDLRAGIGGATGVGGGITGIAGVGGATSGAGGAATFAGGAGTAGNSVGGAASLTGGAGQGSADGASVTVGGGAAGATGGGGNVILQAGAETAGTIGAVLVERSGTDAAELRLIANDGDITGFVAGATGPGDANLVYVLPIDAPTVGQVLSAAAPSAGRSVLSWEDDAGGGNTIPDVTYINAPSSSDFYDSSGVLCEGAADFVVFLYVRNFNPTHLGLGSGTFVTTINGLTGWLLSWSFGNFLFTAHDGSAVAVQAGTGGLNPAVAFPLSNKDFVLVGRAFQTGGSVLQTEIWINTLKLGTTTGSNAGMTVSTGVLTMSKDALASYEGLAYFEGTMTDQQIGDTVNDMLEAGSCVTLNGVTEDNRWSVFEDTPGATWAAVVGGTALDENGTTTTTTRQRNRS